MNTAVEPMDKFFNYQISEQLYVGSRTLVYRAIREADRLLVVIKLLQQEYPTFNELLLFRNQYTIAKNLDLPGIVRPYSLEPYRNSYALVMEDFGGISLRDWLNKKMGSNQYTLTEFLEIAIALSNTLDGLYRHRVIHKDIKPANILINPETKQVKLIDFSIASLLPRESQEIYSPNILEGTLAYLSPEQTGRMNRGIDYRSDYYSLGVTFYELLAGHLPFESSDPMELVHCHIAKQPEKLGGRGQEAGGSREEEIPEVLCDIVMKLMAKNAEDRYQSALGLKFDLEKCLSQLQEIGSIKSFKLGERDICDRFIIPEKLYGRQSEVQSLLNAFERVSQGSTEIMLVAGFSGIGKTAVVNEVHKPIVRQRGYFIKGKFDQFQRNIPFSAFVQAFRDLIGQLLSETDTQFERWKSKILSALGENAQVMIEVIPELERIIGKQSPAPELSGSAAQNRFNLLFLKFTQVFAALEHPLVIFIDDLQWADSASLKLMHLLMSEVDIAYLLLIGAYRDNEVNPVHPLMLTLEEIQKFGATVNTITLAPLDQISVNHLVADTLSCTLALAAPLTELVLSKTKGNPFFSTQFLKALHQDRLITFNFDGGYWECDIAQVRSLALTDDVVEFMAIQLEKLSIETQEVLKLAACVGNSFDLATLAIVYEQSEATTADELWKALQEGFIIPTSDVYKFYQQHSLVNSQNDYGQITISYKFIHDRIQQAAYSLIPDNQKQVTHLHIGRLLQQATTANERDEKIFAIVNHLNQGAALISDQLEQQELVQLNLAAGHKAKGATAYAAALDYFNTGIAMLTGNCWHSQYNLALILYEGATESAYLCTDFEQMEQLAEIVLNHAQSWLDRVKIYNIKIQACIAQNQQLEALRLAREVLKHLGVHLPEQPTPADIGQALRHTQTLLNDRSIESLLELPQMTAPDKKAAMVILSAVLSAAYQAAPDLLPLINLAHVDLSVQYGNAPESTHGYVMYGLTLLVVLGDIDAGYRFGQLGMNLLEHIHAPELTAKTIFAFNNFLRHWQEPAKDTLEGYLKAYSSGLEIGDIQYVALSLLGYSFTAYFSSQELSSLRQTMEAHRQVMQQLRQDTYLHKQSIYYQAVLNLLETTAEPDRLHSEHYNEHEMIQLHLKTNDVTALHQIYVNKLLLSYLFQRYEQALENATLTEQYLGAGKGLMHVPIFYFYDALVRLAVYPDASEIDQISIIERVTAHQEKLSIWAAHAPSNQAHRHALVIAEKCRVLGAKAEAIEYYDRAIAKAKENEYLNEEALANELAAKFYLEWGKERIAQEYLINAYYCYTRWGANAKVDDLEQRYPQLLAPILQQRQSLLTPNETIANIDSITTFHPSINKSVTSSSNTSVMLDLATVLKASQTLSSEIELDKLLTKLLQVVIENAGADKCALLLLKEGRLVVEATAQVGQQSTVLQSIFMEDSADIPHSLIYTVKRSLQPSVILDITLHPVLIADPYINLRQPKSLLCTPILYQGKLLGILYLENNLMTGAFTSDRVEILNLLCTQAAISLENARLYQQAQNTLENLGQTEQFLRLIIENIPQSVFWKDCNSVYLGCNHKFTQTWGLGVPENVIGKTDYDLPWTREQSDFFVARDRRIMEFGEPELNIIETVQQVDGKQKWSNTNKIPLKDKEKNIFGILNTSEDITERQQAQHLLQQQKQQLEQALQELQTMQLQLVQGEKMSALGNLVAGVAHEINNPVGFIAGNIEPAKDYVKDLFGLINLYQEKFPNPGSDIQDEIDAIDLNYLREDLPKLLDSMKLGVQRIRSISTSLRTFSRADKDYKVPFDIHEGIDSTILILRHRLKANENRPAIEVVKNYGKLPLVECFAGQLNQVFMNLLANAIDALEQYNTERSLEAILANPNRITIQTLVADSSQDVLIKIADNGVGMSPEVKQKVFDHLYTTKPVGKGTGLGLAIARQIVVEAHGGSLSCTSELGKGTEFVIQISTQQQ
ncbi:trifunctional serine/threonine-protein kinase/ATP-binding protein/sensor histidine kinase [Nostoc sp. 'Lobaria pulmonaria (5183) cyanobiont']|uniref:trifunctional serine/threonine-protein kinase/ATP-binding protein/sensor histidine kinase n=1 Tax=Nostoc sp. 'Lobaria pulmonaria (5183) cyanobiont' TaxID=1618022 RepID=UPI000CF343FE|nr:AAA family ATPase [Nostoc sp. 'Lobaria pulmonaria (5183) cyanobiont']AVH72646.1 histidine kinase [Nostoc sp. 'Lobaria pulmonaria (5183) cyanobiont']